MLKKMIVSVICLSLFLSTFAYAVPPTPAGSLKTISAQTGPICQYQGQIVQYPGGKALVSYFSNRDTNTGLSLFNFLGGATKPTYDLFYRIVDKNGLQEGSDFKITSSTNFPKPAREDLLDPLGQSLKTNCFNTVADSLGNVFISWTVTDTEKNSKSLWVYKKSAPGNIGWAPRQIASGTVSNARIAPDGMGGLYISFMSEGVDPQQPWITTYMGNLTKIQANGMPLPFFNVAGPSLNPLPDLEIAALPNDQGVGVAYSISNPMANFYEVRVAKLNNALIWNWGMPAPVYAFTDGGMSNYKDVTLLADAAGLYVVANAFDPFSGNLLRVHAQKLDNNGALLWNDPNAPNGLAGVAIPLTTPAYAANTECNPAVLDGSGGVVFARWDFDGDASYNQLVLSGVNSDKTLKKKVPLQMVPGCAVESQLFADGDGGYTVFWADGRNVGQSNLTTFDIYTQRVLNDAVVYPANGKNLSVDQGYKVLPSAIYLDDRYFMVYSGTNNSNSPYSTPNLYDIYYNQFALDGSYMGNLSERSAELIGFTGQLANSLPSGARNREGLTFIAWADNRTGVPQVFANILDKNGNKKFIDIAMQEGFNIGAWPVVALTPDGKYAWVVYTGLTFDSSFLQMMSPGMLSPRALNAVSAKAKAKQVEAKIALAFPIRFYGNKFDMATGSKVMTEDFRIGNAYFGMDLLPAVTSYQDGKLAVAYGSVMGIVGGLVNRAAIKGQSTAPRVIQPSFGYFSNAQVSSKGFDEPVVQESYSYTYLKLYNTDGTDVAGQSPNTPGKELSDPTQTPLKYGDCFDIAPKIAWDGGDNILAVWMGRRSPKKIEINIDQLPATPTLLYGQLYNLTNNSLTFPTGFQLTQPTAGLAPGDVEFHCNPDLASRGGIADPALSSKIVVNEPPAATYQDTSRFGVTWVNLITNDQTGYTKTRIDAWFGLIRHWQVGQEEYDQTIGLWQKPVTDQKTAYYDRNLNPNWNLYFYPSMKFLNKAGESVVSWQDYNQKVPPTSTLQACGLYAMHFDADGNKKLNAPYPVISQVNKAVILPGVIDNQNNNSLSYPTTLVDTGITMANTLSFNDLMLTLFNAIFSTSAKVVMQNVGFIAPLAPVLDSITPTSPTTAVIKGSMPTGVGAAMVNVEYEGAEDEFHVYDTDGNLKAVYASPKTPNFEFAASGLQPATRYTWKLAANNDSGLSPFSPAKTFMTLATAVTGLQVLEAVPNHKLTWNSAGPLVRYKVEVNKGNGWEPFIGDTFSNSTSATETPVQLLPNTIYQFRVGTYNPDGDFNPEWSSVSASSTYRSPAVDRVRISLGGQPGLTLMSGGYVGNALLVRLQEFNVGGQVVSLSAKFTGSSGRVYNWTSPAGVMAATNDGYVSIPINLPKDVYQMEITATNNFGLKSTKQVNIKVDDVSRVLDRQVVVMGKGGTPYGQMSAAGAEDAITIAYQLTKDPTRRVVIRIFDTGGQIVYNKAIPTGLEGAHVGVNQVAWDGMALTGDRLHRGLYPIQVEVDGKPSGSGALVIR